MSGWTDITRSERRLLRHIADNADLLNVPTHINGEFVGHWLVVPLPRDMLDALAAFEADLPEQDDSDRETEAVDYVEEDDEAGGDDEEQFVPVIEEIPTKEILNG